MPLLPSVKRGSKITKFIDFDKKDKIFYDNVYLDEFKIVIKIPLLIIKKKSYKSDIKIEKFDLVKYTYLLAHE